VSGPLINDIWTLAKQVLGPATAAGMFVLVLFIGFCVILGFTKLKKTAGGSARVVKSLDERLTHQPFQYLAPDAPRGPSDQLKAPELLEAAARKS
jgi:hypothetical protein